MSDTSWRQFRQIIAENPQIWQLFETYAFDRIQRGFTGYGAAQILGRVRWETATPLEDSSDYKVNNNWCPYFARHFGELYPEHRGFFELRRSIADRRNQIEDTDGEETTEES